MDYQDKFVNAITWPSDSRRYTLWTAVFIAAVRGGATDDEATWLADTAVRESEKRMSSDEQVNITHFNVRE